MPSHIRNRPSSAKDGLFRFSSEENPQKDGSEWPGSRQDFISLKRQMQVEPHVCIF